MLFMLFLVLKVDENVINEYYDERKTMFMISIYAAGAFFRPNDITTNS